MNENIHAMQEAAARTLKQNRAARPINTTKQYSKKQKEYSEWCLQTRKFENDDVTSQRMNLFLEENVQKKGNKRKRLADGSAFPLGIQSYQAWVKACVDLWATQVANGNHNHPHPRDATIRAFLNCAELEEDSRRRGVYSDRARGTVVETYSEAEKIKVCNFFMQQNTFADLRNKADFLIGHVTLQRGDNRRMWQLPDLMSATVPASFDSRVERESDIYFLVMTQGKCNKFGKVKMAPFLRHSNPCECAVSSLAMYLFARYEICGEKIPNIAVTELERKWYDVYLLYGKSPTSGVSYSSNLYSIKRAFLSCGIQATKFTHAPRSAGAITAEMNGASEGSIRRLGGWQGPVLTECYLRTFPMEAIKALANMDPKLPIFLPRNQLQPEKALIDKIFYGIEEMMQKHKKLDNPDIAGQQFLTTLRKLSIVLLQDSVLLMKKWPHHFIWKHEIFQSDEYRKFTAQQVEILSKITRPEEEKIREVLPLLTKSIYQKIDAVQAEIACLKTNSTTKIMEKLDNIDKSLQIIQEQNKITAHLGGKINQISSNMTNFGELISRAGRSLQLTDTNEENVSMQDAEVESIPEEFNILQELPEQINLKSGVYELSRTIKTVTDSWKEYDHGVSGGPSVRFLEEKYGPAWRPSQKERIFYSRRKKIYDFVKNQAKLRNVSCTLVAKELEDFRVKKCISLDAIQKLISNKNLQYS